MKHALTIVTLLFFAPAAAMAQEDAPPKPELPMVETEGTTLDEFLWVARPVVVFADNPNDPRFIEQMELLRDNPEQLISRDVVVLTDTQPMPLSEIRRELRPRGFSLVIISKDGNTRIRKPFPWDVREITRSIDKMPIRMQELRDLKKDGSS